MSGEKIINFKKIVLTSLIITFLFGCAVNDVYRDSTMDFGSVQTVAVMPFENFTKEQTAPERIRDVFITMLLSTGSIYVIPSGEVAKGIAVAGVSNPTAPTGEEVIKLTNAVKANAVITGVVKEYGELRSGTTSANIISVSVQMIEGQTGRVVWSASSTKGGIGIKDRLFGGGGEPMNNVTVEAVNALLDKLFK